jgi:Helix-turn-helix domain
MSKSPQRVPEFLTSDEVVERLLANPALRRLSATCVLPAIKVGGDWRFRRVDLEAWIARQAPKSIES